MGCIEIVRQALLLDPQSDLAQDIRILLKKLPRQDRLLIIALAYGVPAGVLKRFYSSYTSVLTRRAVERFNLLFEEYRKEYMHG